MRSLAIDYIAQFQIYNQQNRRGWWTDVGTESNTEKEKGQASDSFKRACFNWGIGRELYSAPFTYINFAMANGNWEKILEKA